MVALNINLNGMSWIIIGFLVGALLFYKGFQWFNLKRLIENIPTSKARSIAMGLAEIAGNVKQYQEHILESPITKQKCVYYLYSIEAYVETVDNKGVRRKQWTPAGGSFKLVPYFKISDDTGEVLVKTEGAKGLNRARAISESDYRELNMDPASIRSIVLMSAENAPEAIKKLLTNQLSILDRAEKFRYHEVLVKPGDYLYVIGTAGDNPFVAPGEARKNEENIMIQEGRYDKAFYISDKQERDVVRKLHRDSLLGIFIGAVMMVAFLTIILIKFSII